MKNKLIVLVSSVIRLLRGEVSTGMLMKRGLKVGENFTRESGVRIDTSYCFLIKIGNNVTLAPSVNILAHDASLKRVLGVSKLGRVNIGDNVFIGAGAIVLPNVTIGDNVIIGAGSVVTKNVPDNMVFAGNPARQICTVSALKNKNKEQMLSSPFFNRDFDILNMDGANLSLMRDKMQDECGYFQCDNYEELQK